MCCIHREKSFLAHYDDRRRLTQKSNGLLLCGCISIATYIQNMAVTQILDFQKLDYVLYKEI